MCSSGEVNKTTLAFFRYITQPELGHIYIFIFFKKKTGEKSTDVTSAQDEHLASAGEKRGIYSKVTRAHTCTDSLDTLGRCCLPAAPISSQGGRPWLVSLPTAQHRAHRDMVGPQ